ncbi:MAG TPA: RNA polymerase sigma factor [Solirubrobacterales bacterium]|nr:RNA polymerase sigma factor [Solirubrobacterales bacterium]
MPPPPAELFASRVFLGPALRAQPDRRLVDLVRDGYDSAFEEIVRRYRRPLDRFAAAIVGGRSEDITQDAFSKALLALRGSEAEIELRPWLYRIVRNTALNDLRACPPAAAELSETVPGGRSAAAEAEAREEIKDLMERLGALPEPQRAALVMRELEGLSHEEIAAALGVSGGAARQAIYRARAALREGFGFLVPLPVLRALAEHGGEVAAGGLGAGALKAGMATVLVAGAVSAGVAVEHHGERPGPEAAQAAPLVAGKSSDSLARASSSSSDSSTASEDASHASRERGHDDRSDGDDNSGQGGASLDDGSRSGSSGPGPSGEGTRSGEDSHHSGGGSSGPGSRSGSGSGDDDSGDRHGGISGSDDSGGSHSGSGSGDDGGSSGSSGDSGSSGGSGSDDGLVSGGESSSGSGSGSGEVESEPISEPTLSESSGESGSESSGDVTGSGSDDSLTSSTSGSDGTS